MKEMVIYNIIALLIIGTSILGIMKVKKGFISVFYIVFMISICLLGCNDQTMPDYSQQPQNTEKVKKLDHSKEMGSISYGIINEDGIVETNEVYLLKKGESFERFINIENYLGYDCQFALTIFVNYIQSDFRLDGKQTHLGEVTVLNEKELFMPIELNELKEGYNDIIFLIIPSPSNSKRTAELRFQAIEPLYLRCTILVGDDYDYDYDYDEVIVPTINSTEVLFEKGEDSGIYIRDEMQDFQQYQIIELQKNDQLNFDIILDDSNLTWDKGMEKGECVVILLRNLEQVNLFGKNFLYTTTKPNMKTVIPYEERQRKEGYYEYLAIKINGPYEIIDSYDVSGNISFSGFTGVNVIE